MDKSLIPEHYEAMVKVARKLAKEDMTFFPAIKNNTDKENKELLAYYYSKHMVEQIVMYTGAEEAEDN